MFSDNFIFSFRLNARGVATLLCSLMASTTASASDDDFVFILDLRENCADSVIARVGEQQIFLVEVWIR